MQDFPLMFVQSHTQKKERIVMNNRETLLMKNIVCFHIKMKSQTYF